VRCLYLFAWIFLGILVFLQFSNTSGNTSITWGELGRAIAHLFVTYWRIWLAIAIGIELGAMSHSLSDWLVSAWKREARRQGKLTARPRQKRRRRPRRR
jgi:uncharacterized metal-binding protein